MRKQSTLGQNHCCAIRRREIEYLMMDDPMCFPELQPTAERSDTEKTHLADVDKM